MTTAVKHMPAPCSSCPFRKDSTPGHLGGSAPEVFVGQAFGPFVLPCHKACDFDDPLWREKALDTPQCAGAAIFRANTEQADRMPPAIHRLPKSKAVFDSPSEFLMHHHRITIYQARDILRETPPLALALIEMHKVSVKRR